MAPVIKPAAVSGHLNETPVKHGKRLSTEAALSPSPTLDDEEEEEEDELSLMRPSKKSGGEGTVSKRTLQNRKAQREFRKRREARVRELEERCRRFDQMGLEANSELQRIARSLKEENEAMRAFVMRLGLGSILPNILSGNNIPQQQLQSQQVSGQQNLFTGGFGDFYGNNQMNQPNLYIDNSNAPASSRDRSRTSGSDFSQAQKSGMTLAPTPQSLHEQDSSTQRRQQSRNNTSPSSSKVEEREQGDTPLLSLSLGQGARRSTGQQQQPAFSMSTPQSEQQVSRPFSQNQNPALSGSAMLAGGNTGHNLAAFPIPQRSHQNAALLNPNPIPFAFNFSSGGDANGQSQDPTQIDQQAVSTWWEQMGGGTEGIELDDKAQAVANAQGVAAQQAQSPFDLSAFLTGGVTPGGGFQFGQGDATEESMGSNVLADGSKPSATPDTAHMRLFVQMMERKVAERDARTYASLGFQPPSQDPAHRKPDAQVGTPTTVVGKRARSNSMQFTPSNVYTRLAQHPAFLSTNARELEELVNTLEPASNVESKSRQKTSQNSQLKNAASPKGTAGAASLHGHVDENAVGKMLGLLDQKRENGQDDSEQKLSMVMT